MALFSKKKEGAETGIPPDIGVPEQAPPYQYGAQGYGQDYGYAGAGEQYPPEQYEQYPQEMPPEQQEMGAAPLPEMGQERMEEIAEAVVEEKWKEKESELSKIIEWKEDTTVKMAKLQQQVDDLKSSFDSLHKGMLGKISEYDENLTNVGTEIKAMEKVFSKVLPSLTDSINRLQRISGGADSGGAGIARKKQ